jgi:hypothetical protein
MELSSQRCYHHAHREAVARCPSCHHYYCRECSTEHDGRMLCASCLAQLADAQPKSKRVLRFITTPGALVLGLIATWFFFQSLGAVLVRLPASFHEGRPHQGLEIPDS